MLGLTGVILIDWISLTMTVVVPDRCLFESLSVAVIVVDPMLTAVTSPKSLTVATSGFDELQDKMVRV